MHSADQNQCPHAMFFILRHAPKEAQAVHTEPAPYAQRIGIQCSEGVAGSERTTIFLEHGAGV